MSGKIGWRFIARPEHCHPAVVRMIEEMNRRRISFIELSAISGVGASTLRSWRSSNPGIDVLEAALNALDLELVIRPRQAPLRTSDRNPEQRITS